MSTFNTTSLCFCLPPLAKITPWLRPWSFTAGLIVLTGCSHTPPIQEMSDARQIAQTTLDAGAMTYLPLAYARVQTLLAEAEEKLATKDYQGAGQRALAAKTKAIEIRTLTQTLIETQDQVTEAIALGCSQAETQALLTQALEAAVQGNMELSKILIEQTRQQVVAAITHCPAKS